VLLWHGGLVHMARANRSAMVRVGLNVAYYPRWFNNWMEGGHQPIWPETYRRMPPQMQALCLPRRGRTRAELYEQPD
jgi:ectoine hydroxylase-related dioxygenase (phytanoyl-CoA dioxygenase family)